MTQNFWHSHYPKGLPTSIEALEYPSLAHFFEDAVERFSDYPAFTSNGTTYSYAEWGEKSLALANFLQFDLGLARQQRVAVMLPNLLQYPVALFAILRAGLIVVNTNPLYTPRELKYQLVDSEASAIIILENFAHVLEPILGDTSVQHIILTSVGDAYPTMKAIITYQTSTTLSDWRQLTWPVFWFDFNACFFR
jgi:long-chain acyl-CoA synthetase